MPRVKYHKILDKIERYCSRFIDKDNEEGTGLLDQDVDMQLYLEQEEYNHGFSRWEYENERDTIPDLKIELGHRMCPCCEEISEIDIPIVSIYDAVVEELVYNEKGSRKLFLISLIASIVEENSKISRYRDKD